MTIRDCVVFETGTDYVTCLRSIVSQSAERRTAVMVSAAPIGSQGDMEVVTIYSQNEGRVRAHKIKCLVCEKVNRGCAVCDKQQGPVPYPLVACKRY